MSVSKTAPRIGRRAPEHLIVLLTAAGERPDHLIPTADALVARVPGAAAIILESSSGGEWFPETGDASDLPRVETALQALWPRVLRAAEAEGVTSEGLSVFGFGQGATLALAAAAAGYPFACVLALAGRLVGDLKARRAHSPDLFISCGENDVIASPEDSQLAAEAFSRRGYDCALILEPLLGHEIAAEQLHHGAAFLRGAIFERAPSGQARRASRA